VLRKLVVDELNERREELRRCAPHADQERGAHGRSSARGRGADYRDPVEEGLGARAQRPRRRHGRRHFKDGDARFLEIECKTTDSITVLAAGGKCFTLDAAALPSAAATARRSIPGEFGAGRDRLDGDRRPEDRAADRQ
jgi:hypothetical protein